MKTNRTNHYFTALGLLTLVGFFNVIQLASAQEKIRIGLSSVSATSGSIWGAEEKGLFKKHGIDVELIVIGGGGARGVSPLISGGIQFSGGGGGAGKRARPSGGERVLV